MSGDDMERLQRLARLRADLSGQKAARLSKRIARLSAQAKALRQPVEACEDLALAAAQDRHAAWRRRQAAAINLELARLSAEAEPLRRAHARDEARVAVIGKMRAAGPRRSR